MARNSLTKRSRVVSSDGKFRGAALGIFIVCLFATSARAKYSGGTGEPNSPFLIATPADMNAIGADTNDWDDHFLLVADINMADFDGGAFNTIGVPTASGGPFTGIFDGNGHSISNFHYSMSSPGYNGLFWEVSDVNAEIKNLVVSDANISATVGSCNLLVDYLGAGTVRNCTVQNATITASNNSAIIGGLVTINHHGIIKNCHFTGTIEADRRAGGLVGVNEYGQIYESSFSGSISGVRDVGGIVAWNQYEGIISECCSSGSVSGAEHCIGGLVGWNSATVSNCYSTASVSGDEYVGGLAGENTGIISNCYSTGSVSGTIVGGLVGGGVEQSVNYGFWDINTSSQTESNGGTGKTTEQMKKACTFAAWACDGPIWTIEDSNDYPRLAWENKPGWLLRDLMYKAGSGTENDPYLIETAEQLSNVGFIECDWDKHFLLVSDINMATCADCDYSPPGWYSGTHVYNSFSGTFDGNGHSIHNFTYNGSLESCVGLFGYVSGENAEIRNLGLVDPNIENLGGIYVGAIVGRVDEGTLRNCRVQKGKVSGGSLTGGLSGYGGQIRSCYSSATVSGNDMVGGLVGGGAARVSNSYATGSVTGNDYVGGLIGAGSRLSDRWGISAFYCFSTGQVSGTTYAGGLVGYSSSSDYYISCFWNSTVNPGLDGISNRTDPNVIGKTTAEMWTKTTFTDAGWDFLGESINGPNDFWRMCVDDVNYPKLAWEFDKYDDFECPDGVDGYDLEFLSNQWLIESFYDEADFNEDEKLNLWDWGVFASAWASTDASANWDPNCDVAPQGGDGVIDGRDMAVFLNHWLQTSDYRPRADIAPAGGDGIVNARDFAVLAENWLAGF